MLRYFLCFLFPVLAFWVAFFRDLLAVFFILNHHLSNWRRQSLNLCLCCCFLPYVGEGGGGAGEERRVLRPRIGGRGTVTTTGTTGAISLGTDRHPPGVGNDDDEDNMPRRIGVTIAMHRHGDHHRGDSGLFPSQHPPPPPQTAATATNALPPPFRSR